MNIPTEADWENYWDDLDQQWAHKTFAGKTNEEVQPAFKHNVIERVDELRFMPKKPFQYYIHGLVDYVMKQDFPIYDSSDAASCFLDLIIEKLEEQPDYILPTIDDLMPSIRYVASNQELYDADEDIYGSFTEKLQRIIDGRNNAARHGA